MMRATGLSPNPRADLCWRGDDHLSPRRRARPRGRHGDHPLRRRRCAASCTACPASTRSAPRPRAAGARHPLDQDHRQGVRPRPGDPDGRPDHARGRRHPRQGARAVREGDAARPGRPDLPRRVAAVCVYPDMVADGQGGARRQPASTSPPSPPRSRSGRAALDSSSPTPRTPSRPAPTRSTW